MDIAEVLSQKIGMKLVKELAGLASLSEQTLQVLWQMVDAPDKRTAVNSLWVLTHLDSIGVSWLQDLQPCIIHRLLTEQDASKKRIFLQILREQTFDTDSETTIPLLDYCFSKINAQCEAYAVRANCIYIAFKICRNHPALIAELEQYLDLLSLQQLSPGLKSALRQTSKNISRLSHKP